MKTWIILARTVEKGFSNARSTWIIPKLIWFHGWGKLLRLNSGNNYLLLFYLQKFILLIVSHVAISNPYLSCSTASLYLARTVIFHYHYPRCVYREESRRWNIIRMARLKYLSVYHQFEVWMQASRTWGRGDYAIRPAECVSRSSICSLTSVFSFTIICFGRSSSSNFFIDLPSLDMGNIRNFLPSRFSWLWDPLCRKDRLKNATSSICQLMLIL